MEHPRDLQSLVERAQAGDQEAWECVLEVITPSIREYVRLKVGKKLRRKVGEDDLVQDALLAVFRGMRQFRWMGDAAFHQWLRHIALSVIRDEGRRLGARKRTPEREGPLAVLAKDSSSPWEQLLIALGDSPSQAARRGERLRRLQTALSRLRPEDREVIHLVRCQGLPVKEVAGMIGRTLDATSMLLLRAMRKLKVTYGEIDSTDSLRLPRDYSLGAQ